MSLINDALKKAQKQRTGEAPTLSSMPSVGGESPQRIAKRSKPAGFNTLMVRAGIGGAVVLMLAVGGYFAFRDKPEAGVQKTEVSASQASSSGLPASSPTAQPPASNNQQPVSPPAFTLPVAPKTEPVAPTAAKAEPPPTVVAKSDSPKQTALPKATAQQPAASSQPPAQAAAPALKLDARAIEFIENIKVAGIRASATDAKVLMNDRVYRPGSMVSAEFGLKLVEIANGALTFEDDKGARYTRTF